jgi:uncharacterized Fe-S center protein
MSTVYWIEADSNEDPPATAAKLAALWRQAGLAAAFRRHDVTAVKVHVGEPGRDTFVRPEVTAALVSEIKRVGARPFLTDTAVLYRSPRDNGVDHCRVAHQHGFTIDRVGAPFVPADGILGSDEVEVEVSGKHFDKVSLASAIVRSRSMLVISHATGHLATGYGGTLKNLGMGCSTRKAKLQQHHGHQPRVDEKKCTGCATCAQWCPAGAIEMTQSAHIDPAKCIGCGECIAVCMEDAVSFGWSVRDVQLQERIVEHAAGVVQVFGDRVAYMTVAQQITKDCDCIGRKQPPLLPDLGFFASRDPVALDQAIMDAVAERAGATIETLAYPGRNASVQIHHAEKMGIGQSTYELIRVDAPG